MCQKCRIFLQDFLETGINKDLSLAKYTRVKSFPRILPDVVDWIYQLYLRLPKNEFEKARETASRIARRDRSIHEYEYVLFTATFNMMRFAVPWLRDEVLFLEALLYESGFILYKKQTFENSAQNYIAYIAIKALICLYEIHKDHMNSKGISTSVVKKDDGDTLADDDDYQSAVLAEEDELYF